MKQSFGPLATIHEATSLLLSSKPFLEVESVALDDSLGRVLASDVTAAIDVPSFAKSSMDGYAVASRDVQSANDRSAVVLTMIGQLSPGTIAKEPLGDKQCYEIGTGAPIPPGADAVVMVERTSRSGDEVSISRAVMPGENIVNPSSDVRAGDVVLNKGTLLRPRHLGVLAAVGCATVEVMQRPKVALASTGPELVPVDVDLAPGRIYDINSHTLRAALIEDGCDVLELGVLPDDAQAVEDALRHAVASTDLVIVSGGSSLGSSDHLTDVLEKAGHLLLHGVAVKPGKPLVVGEMGHEEKRFLVVGLPGNPLSALSSYYLFISPLIAAALGTGGQPRRSMEAVLAKDHTSDPGRYEFLPVRLEDGRAFPARQGSSAISEMASSDGYIEIATEVGSVEEGTRLEVRLY